jgi:hypothetical protein
MQIQKTNQLLPGQPPVEPPKGAGVDPAAMLMAGRQGMQ